MPYRPDPSTYGPGLAAQGITQSTLPHNQVEHRARLEIANMFFRSQEVGTHTNTIFLTGAFNPAAASYTLTVEMAGKPTETYTVAQDTTFIADPTDPTGLTQKEIAYPSAIPDLRQAIANASQLIQMPARNVDIVDELGTHDGRTVGRTGPALEPETATTIALSFPRTPLQGGRGIPSPANSFIATGPLYTLVHVSKSERDRADGSLIHINALVAWEGESATQGRWVPYELANRPQAEDALTPAEVISFFSRL